jgi:hypothetical protein
MRHSAGAVVWAVVLRRQPMSQQRWATFSVRAHTFGNAMVSEVLLYDRLVMPQPPPGDKVAHDEWAGNGWAPERLNAVIDCLEELAQPVPWDDQARAVWAEHYKAAQDNNPFDVTSSVIAGRMVYIPNLPPDVSWVRFVAAYTTRRDFEQGSPLTVGEVMEVEQVEPDRRGQLGMLLAHEFLAPEGGDPDSQVTAPLSNEEKDRLVSAVKLARDSEFQEHRRFLYDWQERVIEERLSNEAALAEMRCHLSAYNSMVESAMKRVRKEYLHTLVEAATAGVATAGSAAGAVFSLVVPPVAVAAGVVTVASAAQTANSVVKLVTFDRKPKLDPRTHMPAAMFHDANELWLRRQQRPGLLSRLFGRR